jgi:hypothetical protein
MTLEEAKQYLGDSYVLSPSYRLEDSPQHSLYEPVNVALTFAHVRHRAIADATLRARKA